MKKEHTPGAAPYSDLELAMLWNLTITPLHYSAIFLLLAGI